MQKQPLSTVCRFWTQHEIVIVRILSGHGDDDGDSECPSMDNVKLFNRKKTRAGRNKEANYRCRR